MIAPCGYPPDSCLVRLRAPLDFLSSFAFGYLSGFIPSLSGFHSGFISRFLFSFLSGFVRGSELDLRALRGPQKPRIFWLTKLVVPRRNVLTFICFDYLLFKQFGPRISIWLLVNIFACSPRIYCDRNIT